MTSEQALNDLEKSKSDPNLLLETAANIISLEYDDSSHAFVPQQKTIVLRHQAPNFRAQWLLKWLLKRLNEAIAKLSPDRNATEKHQDKPSDSTNTQVPALLTNPKAWALLNYLLDAIANSTARQILFERRFTEFLVICGPLLHAQSTTDGDTSSVLPQKQTASSENGDKPRKRRKLSPTSYEPGINRNFLSESSEILLVGYVNVTLRYAHIVTDSLRATNDDTSTKSRHAIPAWAQSTVNALALLHSVLQAALGLRHISIDKTSLIASTVTKWLEVWDEFSTAAKYTEKQTINQQFCSKCLTVSLELLELAERRPEDRILSQMKTSLEQRLALSVILPLRATFNSKLAEPWKSITGLIHWSSIGPLYDQVLAHLGSALKTERVLGVDYVSFERVSYAIDLFNISVRIIPRSDLRRRQWERPWLDALYLTLMHLAFPQHMLRLDANKDGLLSPQNADLPFDNQQENYGPSDLLASELHQHHQLSLPTASYLCIAVLRWRSEHILPSVLGQLIQCKADAFIPRPNNPNAALCLDLLLDRIESLENLSEAEFRDVVQNVLQPLLRTFAQSRILPDFIEVWEPRLQNAFRIRSSTHVRPTSSSLLWDDEDMFEEFESALRNHGASKIGENLFKFALTEMQGINQRVGPTTDIFANLAILRSVIRAKSLKGPTTFQDQDLATLINSICDALQQKTDYQGQRWRLWQTWDTLLDFADGSQIPDHVSFSSAFEKLHSDTMSGKAVLLSNSHSPSFLMECLQSFSVAVRYANTDFAESVAKYFVNTVMELSKKDTTEDLLYSSWSGRLTNLQTLPQLISGCLGILLQLPGRRLSMLADDVLPTVEHLVIIGSQITLTAEQLDACILSAARALFDMFSNAKNSNPLLEYISITSKNGQQNTSPLVYSMPLDGLEKGTAQRHADSIVDGLMINPGNSEAISVEDAAEQFALLARFVKIYPVSVGILADFSRFVDLAQTLDNLAIDESQTDLHENGMHLSVCMFCLSEIFRFAWRRNSQISLPNRAKNINKVHSWCSRMLKESETRPLARSELLILDVALFSMKQAENTDIELHEIYQFDEKYLSASLSLSSTPDVQRYLASRTGNLFEYVRKTGKIDNDLTEKFSNELNALARSIRTNIFSSDRNTVQKQDSVNLSTAAVRKLSRDAQNELQWTGNAPLSKLLLQELPLAMSNIDSDTAFKLAVVIANVGDSDLKAHALLVPQLVRLASVQQLDQGMTMQNLVLSLELSKLILTQHPNLIGQSTIDSLLCSLSTIASDALTIKDPALMSTKATYQPSATAIYDRLLAIFDILLARYRRRLNGRSHLQLEVLQRLMRCLFYTPDQTYIHQNPASTKQKQAFRSSLPTWLQGDKSQALWPESAERLSRIISAICNPSTASARSALRRKKVKDYSAAGLNDETQEAKRIAAQYMQYLLMEYSRCSLDGVISPEVREKLMPGLYSILAALGRDLMRTMNAAMDPSSRAIFKGLYDDWVKHGKWDQT